MKLVTCSTAAGQAVVGILQDDHVLDLQRLLSKQIGTRFTMVDLLRWLGEQPAHMRELQALVAAANASDFRALAELQLEAPVQRPGKIVAVGRNYADHAKETGVQPFEKPRIVSKFGSSVARPGALTIRPKGIAKLDFEVELAVVMGRSATRVRRAEALDFVAGYTILNDVSAREFQFDVNPAQTTFAKSMDGVCPKGPYLLTADELPKPQDLELNLWLNGALMQHGHTRDMLFPVDCLIEYISQYVTLEPGDQLQLAITHPGTLAQGIA